MNNNIKGLIFIMIGMLFIITQDILIKYTIFDASLLQILVFRAIIGSLLLTTYLFFTKQPILINSTYPFVAIFRGLSFFFGFTLFFISLSEISLAEATSLFFVSPFFITIFSYFILKIKVGINRIFSICVGFLGTLLIIKPEFNTLNIYMLFPIVAASTYSLSMVLAKKTSDSDNLFQQTFHIYFGAFFGGFLTSIIIHFSDVNLSIFSILNNPWIINDYRLVAIMILISIMGSAGIFFLISAYRFGTPVVLAPFEYIYLVFAITLGYFIFDEFPDFYSIIGLFLIVISGIYIVFRENKRDELIVSETTLRS